MDASVCQRSSAQHTVILCTFQSLTFEYLYTPPTTIYKYNIHVKSIVNLIHKVQKQRVLDALRFRVNASTVLFQYN